MAIFYAIYNRTASGEDLAQTIFESAKTLNQPEDARVLKVEAASVAEAQGLVNSVLDRDTASTTVVVAEAAYKES